MLKGNHYQSSCVQSHYITVQLKICSLTFYLETWQRHLLRKYIHQLLYVVEYTLKHMRKKKLDMCIHI